MTQIMPETIISCVDLWYPSRLTSLKQAAYKQLMQEGRIAAVHVVLHKADGCVTVSYRSCLPHHWMLEELHGAYLAQLAGEKTEQMEVRSE